MTRIQARNLNRIPPHLLKQPLHIPSPLNLLCRLHNHPSQRTAPPTVTLPAPPQRTYPPPPLPSPSPLPRVSAAPVSPFHLPIVLRIDERVAAGLLPWRAALEGKSQHLCLSVAVACRVFHCHVFIGATRRVERKLVYILVKR